MKYIAKDISNEPRSLKEHRSTPGASYDDCNKRDIRQALLKEQGYICAYCMQRINEEYDERGYQINSNAAPRIEHYEAQSSPTGEDLRMNFLNMLAVCTGDRGFADDLLHCDKSRGNVPLTIDPRQESCERYIRYRGNGEIYSDRHDIEQDLHKTLNLNTPYLKNGRKSAINLAINNLKKDYSKSSIKKALKKWEQINKKGAFQPFCQAAIYYLSKKLQKPA